MCEAWIDDVSNPSVTRRSKKNKNGIGDDKGKWKRAVSESRSERHGTGEERKYRMYSDKAIWV